MLGGLRIDDMVEDGSPILFSLLHPAEEVKPVAISYPPRAPTTSAADASSPHFTSSFSGTMDMSGPNSTFSPTEFAPSQFLLDADEHVVFVNQSGVCRRLRRK